MNSKLATTAIGMAAIVLASVSHAESARDILEASGVQGGLVLHLACGDGRITAALGSSESYVVLGLDADVDNVEAALLCQRAENDFVGMNCGIMDQFISRMGKRDHAVLIDCKDNSHRAVTVNTPGYSWLVIDSRKKRGLVDSEYNRRRSECEEGVRCAQLVFSGREIRSLRGLSVNDLDTLEKSCYKTVFRRVQEIYAQA